MTYLPDRLLFVVEHEERLIALSAISPHQGRLGSLTDGSGRERVLFCRPGEVFIEQLHGSIWDRGGRYIGGPADRGLGRIPLRVRDGVVEVAPSRSAAGPPREAGGDPPQGPQCTGRSGTVLEASPGFADETGP